MKKYREKNYQKQRKLEAEIFSLIYMHKKRGQLYSCPLFLLTYIYLTFFLFFSYGNSCKLRAAENTG